MSINHALAVRSDFSIGESSLSLSHIFDTAKELGIQSVAIVDTMSVSCMPDLASKAKSVGIKPILGCTLRVYNDSKWRKPKAGEPGEKTNPMHTLKVYVRNAAGLKQLYSLLTLANDAEHFYFNSRVSFDEVLAHLQAGDVEVSTGDLQSVFHHSDYLSRCMYLAQHFGRLWVEVVPVDTLLFDTLSIRAAEVINIVGAQAIPLMTYPALYPKGQADSADVLRAITSNNKVTDPWHPIPFVRNFEFGVSLIDQSKKLISRGDVPRQLVRDAITNIPSFVALDFFAFEKLAPCLPVMAPDEFAELARQCRDGWTKRFSRSVLGHKPEDSELQTVYKERLVYEFGVIKSMGFSGYFLLVQDIVRWSKTQGIVVGPGRGSVGGSLIAYLMDITDVDPIRFNLLFERFINPSRVDLPDADLDFMSTRRHEVIEYIENKYGKENVAGISNYGTLGAASAMRDTGRVHGLDPLDLHASKQVEKEHGVSLSLEESAESVADIAKFKAKFPDVWRHAVALEGAMRSLGRHAAGVVVAGEPVVNRGVVETRSGVQVVNWDKRTVEGHGLIKMDILGLSTLDILSRAKEYVKARHFKDVDLLSLPLDDERILKAFGRGETVGIFQYESAGMRKLLMELAAGGPLTFEDLAAVTALFRPGPLDAGMCDEYVQIKNGSRGIYYDHPSMEASLAPTYGVLIYQEQVMQLCRDVAGFSMAESDNVRKAMGKKDKEKMAKYQEQFVAGAMSTVGMHDYMAQSLWEKIAGFASYGFNRSHAVEYTVISWWSMWFKVNYAAEFYAAAMSVVDKDEKLASLVLDARRLDIQVLPPDINKSTDRIEVVGERELYAPFQAVKGISEKAAAAIMELRVLAGGAFTGAAQLEALVTHNKMGSKCNKTHRERLERVGAFHSTDGGLTPLHADRLKDRLELMPGFTVDAVKADRKIVADTFVMSKIIRLVEDYKVCTGCSLKGNTHVTPRIGKNPKFVMVFDSPSWQEEKTGTMFEGDTAGYIKAALKDAGLSANEGYYTSLVKAVRPKTQKTLSTEQLNGCSQWLDQEIAALNPPVIIAMGAASVKHFAPSVKGNPSELVGKVLFDPKLNASILFGFNPAQIVYDPSKVALLETAMRKLAEIVN